MVNKDCYDRWDKICNTDAVLYHMSRLTLRVEYTKLHYCCELHVEQIS